MVLTSDVISNNDATYRVEFTPNVSGPFIAHVTFCNEVVPNSPFKFSVVSGNQPDASKVKVYGPALENAVNVDQLACFFVDCKDAGVGEFVLSRLLHGK